MSTHDHDLEFADFFRQNNRRLRGYLRSLGAPPDLIDEVAPFAFMVMRRHWERLRLEMPRAYLFTVGQREVNKRRGRYHSELVNTYHFDPASFEVADQHNQVDGLIDRLTLDKLVQQLPSSLRQAVTLRHVHEFNITETAMIMNVGPGTVKRYTSDGLKALKMLAAREGDNGEAGNP